MISASLLAPGVASNDGVPHAHALELSKHVNDSKVDLLSAACVDAIRVSEGRDD